MRFFFSSSPSSSLSSLSSSSSSLCVIKSRELVEIHFKVWCCLCFLEFFLNFSMIEDDYSPLF